MKYQNEINDLRRGLAEFVANVDGASAMQLTDLSKLAENLVLGMLRELLDLPNLRNLNTPDQPNHPAIDLADDEKRVAIQVTASTDLDKIKNTLSTFLRHDLDRSYDRLIVYILSKKQDAYSQRAVDAVVQDRFHFSVASDVLDYRDLLSQAPTLPPAKVRAALEVLYDYQRGGVRPGLLEEDFDPPASTEAVTLNLIEVFFPSTLYVADLLPEVASRSRGRGARQSVRGALRQFDQTAPSDFVVNAGRIITFLSLEDSANPFEKVTDPGTVMPLHPAEFYAIDNDHERVFKSLLRFALQQKLYKRNVRWQHEDALFYFVPLGEGDLTREETWMGERVSTRTVYERKLKRNDEQQVFAQRHFAFGVEFLRVADRWYAALTPDWYFSHGDDFRRSFYAEEKISWLKRRENNRKVYDHFRFLTSWLGSLDMDDLFSAVERKGPEISFGETVRFDNHPHLDDDLWLPTKDVALQDPDLF